MRFLVSLLAVAVVGAVQFDASIENLQLGPIENRVVREHGWTQEKVALPDACVFGPRSSLLTIPQASAVALEYKRFLQMLKSHPEARMVPSQDVDEVCPGHNASL